MTGALAAAAWQACDPLLKRTFGTPYCDAELIGPFITRGRYEWLANLVTHAAAGATFGFVFERLGGRGVKQGVTAALVENTLLWPGIAALRRDPPEAARRHLAAARHEPSRVRLGDRRSRALRRAARRGRRGVLTALAD